MPPKLDMTPEQYKEHVRELGRARAKRNYERNKEKINEKRKEERDYLADLKKQEEDRQKDAVRAAQDEEERTVKVVKKSYVKDGKRIKIMKRVPKYDLEKSIETAREMGLYKQYASNIRTIFRLTGCPDLGGCLKKYDEIRLDIENAKLDNGEDYSLNSKKQYFQAIVKIIDSFEGLKEQIPAEIRQKYVDLFEVYKLKSKEQTDEVNKIKTIPSWDKYLRKVIEVFGEKNKEFLISSLYSCVPVRDDLYLEIKANDKDQNQKQNYIIVPKSGNCYVIINTYKTENKYGANHKYQLTKDINKLVREYIKTNKLETGDYLFKEKKLSLFVSDMNKKLGIESISKNIGIKVFRQMTASAGIPENATPEERVKLASKMLHSVRSQMVYRRQIEKG